jgi:hypothetical protein
MSENGQHSKLMKTYCLPLVLAVLTLTACSKTEEQHEISTSPVPGPVMEDTAVLARYLYVWARDRGKEQTDFFSVFDVDPGSETYGHLLSTVPMGIAANAHHSEHFMPEGDLLFMNGFMTGNSFVVNVADPLAPAIESHFTNAGPFTYPHSFERIPGGNVLSTFQNIGEPESGAGGLVELDPLGQFVRGTDAVDPVDPDLRPYSLAPIPELDRVVTTTGDMWMKLEGKSVQIWRLSDLTLLKTILLPPGPKGDEHLDVAEARLLDDGKTVVVTTFHCGMYVLTGVDSDDPAIEFVHSFPFESYDAGDGCGVPWRYGDFWIQTVEKSSSLHVLDISDPHHPVEVSTLFVGKGEDPHWISGELGGNRIALTGSGEWLDGRVILLQLDQDNGKLSVIEDFRSPGADRPGADMNRESWPHGDNGPAVPHGTVFSRRR